MSSFSAVVYSKIIVNVDVYILCFGFFALNEEKLEHYGTKGEKNKKKMTINDNNGRWLSFISSVI